jgi:hypothetical protein
MYQAGHSTHPLLTSSYHPQSNGLVEQFHRQLNDGLRARLAGGSGYSISRGSYCAWELPQKRTAHISLAKMAYGLTLTLPGEFLNLMKTTVQEIVEGINSSVTNYFPFPPGQLKYCRKYLIPS